jgi:hypothetical protein
MKDRNEPNADPRVDALLDGITPGDPFSEAVERRLNSHGGPVAVDEEALKRGVASVTSRINGQGRESGSNNRTPMAVGGLIALAAGGLFFALQGAPTAGVSAPAAGTIEVPISNTLEIRAGSTVKVREDVVLVAEGVVSVHHDGPDATGPHSVQLTAVDVLVDPIGTVYYAGSRGRVAAVWVEEGAVRLTHDSQGPMGEVQAGSWAVLMRHPGVEGIAMHRIDDGPFDAASVGIADSDLSQLLADVRWMALPLETRTGILGGTDAH